MTPRFHYAKGRDLPLSPRDKDCLVALVEHAGRKAAAYALGISPGVVKKHVSQASHRLGARNTTHAVALAFPMLRDRYLETPDRRRMYARLHS